MIHIGIDTSNYKTSLAAIDASGRVLVNISEYLDVPYGQRGLRQSDAFFKHSNRLPDLFDRLSEITDIHETASIGVSSRPRRVEGSYMPCFRAGVNLAHILARSLNADLYDFSHQEGHAAAIIDDDIKDALFMHLSGGTTEILKIKPDDKGYEMNIIGGTLDISFGQLLDRFGVALGLPFPAGMYIDKFASDYKGDSFPNIMPGVHILDGYFNLSGAETRLMEFASNHMIKAEGKENNAISDDITDESLAAVSAEIFDRIADILIKSSDYLTSEYNIDKVYIAGGVASSSTLRSIIENKHNNNYDIIFGSMELSGDNAVGIARLARRMHMK